MEKKRGLVPTLQKLKTLVQGGLKRTKHHWPALRQAYAQVHRAASILKNQAKEPAARVRRRLAGLLGAITRHRPRSGKLKEAMQHFVKVTHSYWPGLFHCYRIEGLERTNNGLEHLFGSHRHHERRATGRRHGSPAMVLRGPVRLVAATSSRLQSFRGADLALARLQDWQAMRAELEQRRQARVLRCRFRKNPIAYLAQLEERLLKPTLPV